MRNLFFAAFALIVSAALVLPVRGQDITPPPRDPPAGRSDKIPARLIHDCEVLKRAAAGALCDYPRPFSCDPTDDRACEVFLKMHGVVRDERRIRDYYERKR